MPCSREFVVDEAGSFAGKAVEVAAQETATLERQALGDEAIELGEQVVAERGEVLLGHDVADHHVPVAIQCRRELIGVDVRNALIAHAAGASHRRLLRTEGTRASGRISRPRRCDQGVDVGGVVGHATGGEPLLDALAAAPAELDTSRRVRQERAEIGGQRRRIVGRREQARHPVVDDLDRSTVVEGHDRQRHRHRLGVDQAERLPSGGHGEHVGGSHQRRHVVAEPEESHTLVEARVAHHRSQLVEVARLHLLADHEQQCVGYVVAQVVHGLHELGDALRPEQATHRHHDRCGVVDPDRRAGCGPVASG